MSAASYLCGAQALGIAWAQRTKAVTNTRDYGFMHGVGVEEIRGVQKLAFGVDPRRLTLQNQSTMVWSDFMDSLHPQMRSRLY